MSRKRGFKLHFMSFCLAVFVIFSTFFYAPINAHAKGLGTVNVGTGRVSSGWQYGQEHYLELSNEDYDAESTYGTLTRSENATWTSVVNIPMSMVSYQFPSNVNSVIMSLTSNIQYGFTMYLDRDEHLYGEAGLYIREVALILNGERYILPIASNDSFVEDLGHLYDDDEGSIEVESEVCFLDLGSYVSFDLNNLKDISRWDMSLQITYDMQLNAHYRGWINDLYVQPWFNWYAGTDTETFKFYCYSDGSEELQKDLIALQQQENTLQETGNNLQSQGNQIAQQTQKDINSGFGNLANGFDSSAGESMNDGFTASLDSYQTSEDSLFTSAKSGIEGFTFVDFSSYPALVTSMSFVTSMMTSIFGAMGGESGPAGIVLSVLFSVMLVSMVIGLYRFYSGKKDGDG